MHDYDDYYYRDFGSANRYVPKHIHVMGKPEAKVMRRLRAQTGLSEEEIRSIKKYRVMLSEAQKNAHTSVWSDVEKATNRMLRKITRKLKLPKDHPEVRKRYEEEWKKYWKSNKDKILEHYDSTIGEERVLMVERKKEIFLEEVLSPFERMNIGRRIYV